MFLKQIWDGAELEACADLCLGDARQAVMLWSRSLLLHFPETVCETRTVTPNSQGHCRVSNCSVKQPAGTH